MFEPFTADQMADEYRIARAEMFGTVIPKSHRILAEEAARRGLTIEDLKSAKRHRDIAWPRQEIMHRLRAETDLSLPQIGRMFRRDHTTVLHSLRAVEKRQRAEVMARLANAGAKA